MHIIGWDASADDPRNAMTLALEELRVETGLEGHALADQFRQWGLTYVLWHDLGHLESDAELARLKTEMERSEWWRFDGVATETCANAYALRRLEKEGDEGLRKYWMTLLPWKVCRPGHAGRTDFRGSRDGDVFLLRALHSDQGSEYLFRLLRRMREMAVRLGDRRYRRWMQRCAQKAQGEIRDLARGPALALTEWSEG